MKHVAVSLALLSFLPATLFSAPSYVQSAFACPQTPQATVLVQFQNPEVGGDLNIIIVGWADTNAQVVSVTDQNGNIYQLAVGPVTSGAAITQSIYYATLINGDGGGSPNTVTVVFNQAAVYPDIRVLEYSGVDTLDAVASTASASTPIPLSVTATGGTDILLCADTTTGASTDDSSTGFFTRILTSPDADLTTDGLANGPATYTDNYIITPGAQTAMEMVAFTLSSLPAPTPAPPGTTATPSPLPAQPNQGNRINRVNRVNSQLRLQHPCQPRRQESPLWHGPHRARLLATTFTTAPSPAALTRPKSMSD